MKNKPKSDLSLSAGWKSLKSKSSRRPVSRPALRKKLNFGFKFSLLAVLFVAGLSALIWGVFLEKESGGETLKFSGSAVPIKQIQFSSDGALSHQWFARWLGPVRQKSLLDIDLKELHAELIKEEQIIGAQILRVFPAKLVVRIEERHPVLVLRLKDKNTGFKDWFVSADGSVYRGEGYSNSWISTLPSLKVSPTELKLNATGEGFQKLSGIPYVAPLLELARRQYPDFYRDWSIVSYDRPSEDDPGAHILVKSKKVGRIRFAPTAYASQLRRMRYLLTEPRFRQSQFIRSIDLSHDRSVFAKI
jgi:hypothetical protein